MLTLLYLICRWLIRLVMIPVVARHHRPYVALSWLAPIFLFPILGTLLYLWVGYYGLKRSAGRHRAVRHEVERDDQLREQREHRVPPGFDPDQRRLVRLAERLSTRSLGGFPILGGNRLALLDRPGSAMDRLVAEIDAAREHVHLLFYLFVDDATGQRVADALCRASERGVECRLLVDAWASRGMRRALEPAMERRGVQVRSALPFHPLRHPLARVDIRNHRKIAVIDGRVAYTGSANVHDPGHALERGIWHQLSVRLEGPAVLQLQMVFVEDWYFAGDRILTGERYFPPPERPGDVPVQTVPGGPSYTSDLLQHVLVQALQEADRRATLTTPYLIPDEPLLLALRLAALRGVEVDLILPRTSDRRIADLAGRTYFDALLDAGARIHLHPSGILHAKTATIDDQIAVVGTANFDRRSLFLNYEVLLLVYQEAFTRELHAVQQRWQAESTPLDDGWWERQPPRERWLQSTAKLLSPVL